MPLGLHTPLPQRILATCSVLVALVCSVSTAAADTATAGCPVTLATQQTPPQGDWSNAGVSTKAVSINSFSFSAGSYMTVAQFISTPRSEVEARLARFIAREDSGLTKNPAMHVIADIEYPVSPRDFSEFLKKRGDQQFKALIAAFKLRLEVANALLPNAKLGVYGVPIPRGSDSTQERLQEQMQGIHYAARLGLFDSVDAIHPVLYLRFGKADKSYKSRTESYTRAGIAAAMTVRRTDGSAPSVVPLFSHRIYNGLSKNNGEVGPPELARLQLTVARDFRALGRVSFWAPTGNADVRSWLKQATPGQWCVVEQPKDLRVLRTTE